MTLERQAEVRTAPTGRSRRALTLTVSCLISAGTLYLALRNVEFGDVVRSLRSISPEWPLLAAVIQLFILWARAWRWQAMFPERVGFSNLFWTQATGYLVNNILPFRLGDIARILLLRAVTEISSFRIGITIVFERLLDVATVLVVFAGTAYLIQVPGSLTESAFVFGVLMAAAIVGGVLFYFFATAYAERVRAKIVQRFLSEFLTAVAHLTPRRLVKFVITSAICLVLSIAMSWSVLKGFNPQATWLHATVLTVAVSLAMALPSAPGHIGVFQLAGQLALTVPFAAEYDAATALAAAFALHAVFYIGTSSLGLIGIFPLQRRVSDGTTIQEVIKQLSRLRRSRKDIDGRYI